MPLTIEGHGFVAELDAAPSDIALSGDACGHLGVVFGDFTYSARGSAKVWVTGAQIGVCQSPRGVMMSHEAGLHAERYELTEDAMIVRGPDSFSDAKWTDGFHGRFLTYSPETIERLLYAPLSRVAFKSRDAIARASDEPAVTHLLAAVASDLAAGNPGGPMFIETLSVAALRSIIMPSDTKKQERGLTHDQARAIRMLIIEQSAEQLSLVDLADAVGMSVGHMLRSFKVTFGITPHQYIIRERVDCAVAFLKTTNMTLDEIAADCGFGSKGQMARTFRATLGVSPTDIRTK